MASESTDESVSVSLPPELAEWVDQLAAERDADRETVLVQLVAAHRAADALEDGDSHGEVTVTTDVEDDVRDIVAERLPDIAGAVADQLDVERQVETAVDARMEQASETAAERARSDAERRIDAVEEEFVEKLTDVRERVVQVKQETDGKAPADHTHEDLTARLDDLEATLAEVSDEVTAAEDRLTDRLDDTEAELDELSDSLADAQGKLRTVAHVVKDLREATALDNKRATSVESIKRSAAEHDVDRAACEACGEGVSIPLMTDPECPHCQAVVTDVAPKEGLFGKPKLVTAHGIEPPEDDDA